MTEQHTPEDWKLLTAEALIERCVLYIQRIAELQRDKAIVNELLGSAQGEIKRQQARIAELEAAQPINIDILQKHIDEYLSTLDDEEMVEWWITLRKLTARNLHDFMQWLESRKVQP